MTTPIPVRTVPKWFPDIALNECYNHKVLKASLIRKIAMAQNFLWSRGRTYGTAYEGQGMGSFNGNSGALETVDGAMVISTFYVPQSYGPNSTLQVDVTIHLSLHVTGARLILRLENLDGTIVTSLETTGLTSGLQTIEMEVPKYGEYQCRVLIVPGGFSGASSSPPIGSLGASTTHVSARWKPDVTNYITSWVDLGADFFPDYTAVSSLYLTKLVQNLQHLWASRQPELCQSYLGPVWTNGVTATFIEVGRYNVWTPAKVTKYSGKLYVYCTSGGAGNAVRVLLNGVVVQTFSALAAGYTELTLSAGKTMTAGQFNVFTVEAESTDAANWGTCVWGVYLWENGCTIPSLPAAYKPLDETGLSGDSFVTAQDKNSFSQRTGLRNLFNNDRWLAGNRFRVMVSDWRHRTFKRGGLRGGNPLDPDQRTDWTFDLPGADYNGLQAPKNITVRADRDSTPAFNTNDALGDWPAGEGNMAGTYVETPFAFPITQTYYHQGRRLAHIPLMDGTGGENTSGGAYGTTIEAGGGFRILARAARIRPAKLTQDTDATAYFVADDDGSSLDANDQSDTGGAFLAVEPPSAQNIDMKLLATTAADDHKLRWLQTGISDHDVASGYVDVKGYTPPAATEGTLWEVHLSSLFVEDIPLGQAQIDALA